MWVPKRHVCELNSVKEKQTKYDLFISKFSIPKVKILYWNYNYCFLVDISNLSCKSLSLKVVGGIVAAVCQALCWW